MVARRVLGEQGEGIQHGPAFWELGECVLPDVFLSSPGSPRMLAGSGSSAGSREARCPFDPRGSVTRAGPELGLWREESWAGRPAQPLAALDVLSVPEPWFPYLDSRPVAPLRLLVRTERDRRPGKRSPRRLVLCQSRTGRGCHDCVF